MPEIAELPPAASKEAMPAMSFLDHLEELRNGLLELTFLPVDDAEIEPGVR